jgi:hypothetical protein
MKVILTTILYLLSCSAFAGEPDNHEFLYEFLAGKYFVVGKAPDSQLPYYGKVELKMNQDHLMVVRNINGKTISGIGHIEHASGGDQVNVLRVRFEDDGKKYEATYLWRSDLDNYARISGYLYQPGVKNMSPGMEALFIDHQAQ